MIGLVRHKESYALFLFALWNSANYFQAQSNSKDNTPPSSQFKKLDFAPFNIRLPSFLFLFLA